MPHHACSSGLGLLVTALVALLLLPSPYLLPQYLLPAEQEPAPPAPTDPPAAPADDPIATLDFYISTLDMVFIGLMVLAGCYVYVSEGIQMKLMERRIVKLNQYLGASVARLRAWQAQEQQLAGALRLVQQATSEYDLLLYLLLRRQRLLPDAGDTSSCFFEKHDEDFHFGTPRSTPDALFSDAF